VGGSTPPGSTNSTTNEDIMDIPLKSATGEILGCLTLREDVAKDTHANIHAFMNAHGVPPRMLLEYAFDTSTKQMTEVTIVPEPLEAE